MQVPGKIGILSSVNTPVSRPGTRRQRRNESWKINSLSGLEHMTSREANSQNSVSHRKQQSKQGKKPPWADLSLYIQQPHSKPNARSNNMQPVQPDSGVFVFRRALTEGPENTSRIVGKARGFIIPNEQFARSSFNIIYLSFDNPEYAGSLSVHAKHIGHEKKEEMSVVGGTGSFAFAQGIAVFIQTDEQASVTDTSYHLKLQLQFPK